MASLLLHETLYNLDLLHATELEYNFPRFVSCRFGQLFDHSEMEFQPLIAHSRKLLPTHQNLVRTESRTHMSVFDYMPYILYRVFRHRFIDMDVHPSHSFSDSKRNSNLPRNDFHLFQERRYLSVGEHVCRSCALLKTVAPPFHHPDQA